MRSVTFLAFTQRRVTLYYWSFR